MTLTEFEQLPISALLLHALKDLRIVEKRSKTYVVNMHRFHFSATPVSKCHVCLAGAVMVGTLKVPKHINVLDRPANNFDYPFSKLTTIQLHKLDKLRRNNDTNGRSIMSKGSFFTDEEKEIYYSYQAEFASYEQNSKVFKKWLTGLALTYQAKGL